MKGPVNVNYRKDCLQAFVQGKRRSFDQSSRYRGKFGVFAPQERHVAPMKVKFGVEESTPSPSLVQG